MRNPIIYRIQEPPPAHEALRDYSSCVGYGEMVTILGHLDNPSIDPDECYRKIIEALSDAKDGDYVLWAGGDPMSAFMAGLALGALEGEDGPLKLKWLRWDRRTDSNGHRTRHGYYTPVEF